MANVTRTFVAGRMNKVVDERLVPNGEYIDALNIRMGSTENSEIGVIENSKGNDRLTFLAYIDGTPLSVDALCIGALEDSANDTLYWFVHDPNFTVGATGKLDLIVSYNANTSILTYHVVSIDDGGGVNTTLNFNPSYTITGVNIIDNLLFFTDDYNQPRFINVTRQYAVPVANIDAISAESLLVIKKPPTSSPAITPYRTSSQENFMETRFICFAYRYRYADGEYSATSQWSEPAFIPNPFEFSTESFLNEGMVNFANACDITYNSGGPLVVGIDLLFKNADSNIIKVIEKLDKTDLGLANNTDYQYQFNNSKIFTVLPESELLRLYDNVPRLAKAQTTMGNRLMYGNYTEGYDMIDANGFPVNLEYFVTLNTEDIGTSDIPDTTSNGNYNINGALTVNGSIVEINLDPINFPLVAGSSISWELNIAHSTFTGTGPFPAPMSDVQVSFTFFLQTNYTSVYQMATSVEFLNAVGTNLNIKPVYAAPGNDTSCDGSTFTDILNCALPNTLGTFNKYASGITASSQPIAVIASPASNVIGLQLIAMEYVDAPATPTVSFFNYYTVSSAQAVYQQVATPKSLHSNRGYEIGIVYMDEFNRSTTALVSPNNTLYVPCENSYLKNYIQVTIPTTQIAPSWASKYKFVIKPDAETYETIFSNIFVKDTTTNNWWFLLDGENARKIEVGDRLIVKSDSSGTVTSCVYATVLDKQSKAAGFIGSAPSGVYMRINPNDFSVEVNPDAVFQENRTITTNQGNSNPTLNIDFLNSSGDNVTIPSGSRIILNFTWKRIGGYSLCEKREYYWSKTFISSANYDNFRDWFVGDGIETAIDSGTQNVGPGGGPIDNTYIALLIPLGTNAYVGPLSVGTNFWRFEDLGPTGTGDAVRLWLTGTESCPGVRRKSNRMSSIQASVTIFRAVDLFVFETEPVDALPDVFYENEQSFDIDTNGQHLGNVQDQNFATNQSAIIDTTFHNCYAFGNGVESYKIRDSVVGKQFNLGNRVTSVSAQDYKEADRYADITYSGIYNNESNVNKLNEFNLGLINFKALEDSFGGIFKLDGRETDVLVLQEDKVSYVLAGKNLLSDSAAGGAITSVPEVLGTQIARVEKYGISQNPESYIHWGYDRYFTDVKRGAVIQLKGNSYSNDQLRVVSEQGMRTWFRDEFNAAFNTQKLGGFDPYMNEYVLSSNERQIPGTPQCVDCGIANMFVLAGDEEVVADYCVGFGQDVGLVTVSWVVNSITVGSTFEISSVYNSVTNSSGLVNTAGSFTFNKNSNTIDFADINIFVDGEITITVTVSCPVVETLTLIEVVVTNQYEVGETIHVEYRYIDGAYVSPTQSNLVTFSGVITNPLISRYNLSTGAAGSAAFPTAGSTVFLQTNKIVPDTFDFSPLTDKFRYHRSNTLYTNTPVDIQSLLSLSSVATPIVSTPPVFYSTFTVPPSVSGQYLYLIWDFRDAIGDVLCFGTSLNETCCECEVCETNNCIRISVLNPSATNTSQVSFPNGACNSLTGGFSIELDPLEDVELCVYAPWIVLTGDATITMVECDCSNCAESCSNWVVETNDVANIEYISCEDTRTVISINESDGPVVICAKTVETPLVTFGIATVSYFNCGCYAELKCFTMLMSDNVSDGPWYIKTLNTTSGSYTAPASTFNVATDGPAIVAWVNGLNPGVLQVAGYVYTPIAPNSANVQLNYYSEALLGLTITNGVTDYSMIPIGSTSCTF